MHSSNPHHCRRCARLAGGRDDHEEISSDYPELTEEDIRACLTYAPARDKEREIITITLSRFGVAKLAIRSDDINQCRQERQVSDQRNGACSGDLQRLEKSRQFDIHRE